MSDEKQGQPLPLPDATSIGRQEADATAPSRGLLSIILLGPHGWKRWWFALVRSIGHEDILAKSQEEATFTFHYAFMVAIASGIATIGLLFNSPAVIIGAMLISPLMGPIVSLGFAIAGFEVHLGKQGARTLLFGAVIAILFAAAIVGVSPVNELTPEIIARTRPNLFDLAVAILSGAAGGYAMIRGRGGAIVGVAIATALMPPLAVIGYGLATWQWLVARGAMLLFVTNMVAIALAVAAVAEWYGFGRGGLRKRFAKQAMIALVALTPLSIPLYVSLKSIAWESRVHATVRSVLDSDVARLEQGQVAQVRVHFSSDGKLPFVEAIVVSKRYQRGLNVQTRGELERALGVPVNLRLIQLRADDPEALSVTLSENRHKQDEGGTGPDFAAALRTELPFPLAAIEADSDHKTVVIMPRPQAAVGLAAWREIELNLSRQHPDWHLTIVPPTAGFPAVEFAPGAYALTAAAQGQLQVITWALQRWGVQEVHLTGHASSIGGGTLGLAERRVKMVGKWLGDHGIAVKGRAIYPVRNQTTQEREIGEAAFRSVEIILAAPTPVTPPEANPVELDHASPSSKPPPNKSTASG